MGLTGVRQEPEDGPGSELVHSIPPWFLPRASLYFPYQWNALCRGNQPSPPTLLFVMVFITATEKQTRTEGYLGPGIFAFLLGYPT